MIYHSTRDKQETAGSREAVLQGLCRDGGLFVSDELSDCRLDVEELLPLSYKETAKRIFGLLLGDYSSQELSEGVEEAYGSTFSAPEVTPLTRIGENWLLELYHGPTSAFKDVALCMLPQLMSKALSGTGKRVMIVTATSGDTGKAALNGFRDVKDVAITVFYPEGKVSDIQRLQMITQEGENVAVCGIRGNFDDAQSAVKTVFSSGAGAELEKEGIFLSSANSINVGRLIPQVVYYFEAYKALRNQGVIRKGECIDFCVPTGNFGDVLAGYYGKLMGLPIRHLIVASNENNVLTDFIRSGVYDRNRPFHKTISPSMDILISSNLERMLYYMSGGDVELIRGLMQDLKEKGRFQIEGELLERIQEVFPAGCADDEKTRAGIRRAYEEDGRLIDPHTAVGYQVMQEKGEKGVPCVLLSTASPYKFCRDVYEALFGPLSGEADGFAYMDALREKTGVEPPEPLKALRGKAELHKDVIDPEEIGGYVMKKAMEKLGSET